MGLSPAQCLGVAAVLAALTGVPMLSATVSAQSNTSERARAQLGAEIARLWCSHCHVVEPEGTGMVQPDVPSFREVANRTNQTAQRIEGFIQEPHPPMPKLNLTREEKRNLSTYILSLKDAE